MANHNILVLRLAIQEGFLENIASFLATNALKVPGYYCHNVTSYVMELCYVRRLLKLEKQCDYLHITFLLH